MAKAKRNTVDRNADDVMVMARAGFKHRGVFIRTGESVYMNRAEARDMVALNMVQPLEELHPHAHREPSNG